MIEMPGKQFTVCHMLCLGLEVYILVISEQVLTYVAEWSGCLTFFPSKVGLLI